LVMAREKLEDMALVVLFDGVKDDFEGLVTWKRLEM